MKKAKLLWVDLEMTGLSPEKDRILEIAAIGTGWDLKNLCEFTAIVKVSESLMKERMVGDFWEKNTESRDSLMKQNSQGEDIKEVEQKFLKYLEKNFSEEIILAGNSIHQDRKFIDRELPAVSERLHYRMLDVSAWKVYFENVLKKKFVKPEEHRALSDIQGSIEEFKYYLTFIKR